MTNAADHDALREGLARWFLAEAMDPQGRSPEGDADAVLGLPELAPLLAKAESAERVAAERDEAREKNGRCPIGLDEHRGICSAGYCQMCLADRLAEEGLRADRLAAENAALRTAQDEALRKAIRAWSAKLHIPVTRMMSRALRDEFAAALRTAPPAGTDAPVQEGTR